VSLLLAWVFLLMVVVDGGGGGVVVGIFPTVVPIFTASRHSPYHIHHLHHHSSCSKKPLREDMCEKLNRRKNDRTIDILETTYGSVDVQFLQEVRVVCLFVCLFVWLVGWLFVWLVGWLVVCLFVWLFVLISCRRRIGLCVCFLIFLAP
jgi:hypothetical protein